MRPIAKISPGIHRVSFAKLDQPISTEEATMWTVEILDASYEKADIPKVITDIYKHLCHTE